MTLKTFNLDGEIYKQFSEFCKKEGISMSRKVENYIRGEVGKINAVKKLVSKTKREKGIEKPAEEHSFSKYC